MEFKVKVILYFRHIRYLYLESVKPWNLESVSKLFGGDPNEGQRLLSRQGNNTQDDITRLTDIVGNILLFVDTRWGLL